MLLSGCRDLRQLEVEGNPLCFLPKYREEIIAMSMSVTVRRHPSSAAPAAHPPAASRRRRGERNDEAVSHQLEGRAGGTGARRREEEAAGPQAEGSDGDGAAVAAALPVQVFGQEPPLAAAAAVQVCGPAPKAAGRGGRPSLLLSCVFPCCHHVPAGAAFDVSAKSTWHAGHCFIVRATSRLKIVRHSEQTYLAERRPSAARPALPGGPTHPCCTAICVLKHVARRSTAPCRAAEPGCGGAAAHPAAAPPSPAHRCPPAGGTAASAAAPPPCPPGRTARRSARLPAAAAATRARRPPGSCPPAPPVSAPRRTR